MMATRGARRKPPLANRKKCVQTRAVTCVLSVCDHMRMRTRISEEKKMKQLRVIRAARRMRQLANRKLCVSTHTHTL